MKFVHCPSWLVWDTCNLRKMLLSKEEILDTEWQNTGIGCPMQVYSGWCQKLDDKLLSLVLHLRITSWCPLSYMKMNVKLISVFHCWCPSSPGVWTINSNNFHNNISPSQRSLIYSSGFCHPSTQVLERDSRYLFPLLSAPGTWERYQRQYSPFFH